MLCYGICGLVSTVPTTMSLKVIDSSIGKLQSSAKSVCLAFSSKLSCRCCHGEEAYHTSQVMRASTTTTGTKMEETWSANA